MQGIDIAEGDYLLGSLTGRIFYVTIIRPDGFCEVRSMPHNSVSIISTLFCSIINEQEAMFHILKRSHNEG